VRARARAIWCVVVAVRWLIAGSLRRWPRTFVQRPARVRTVKVCRGGAPSSGARLARAQFSVSEQQPSRGVLCCDVPLYVLVSLARALAHVPLRAAHGSHMRADPSDPPPSIEVLCTHAGEQRLSARRAPTIVLRPTRPQVEDNPLAEFVGDHEAAMRDPPRANRMALSASCSEVKATRHAAGASGYRKGTSRYAYDIHRQVGPQRVHPRPTFHYGASNRQRCPVRHELHVTDGRAKSTAERKST
jgi:hypothetical protein